MLALKTAKSGTTAPSPAPQGLSGEEAWPTVKTVASAQAETAPRDATGAMQPQERAVNQERPHLDPWSVLHRVGYLDQQAAASTKRTCEILRSISRPAAKDAGAALGTLAKAERGGRQNLRFPKAAQLACARGTGSTPELRASNVQVLPTGGYCWSSRRSRQPGRPSRSGARPHEETETRLYKPPRR